MIEAEPNVADRIRERMDDLRPAERKVARTLLSDYPSSGLSTVAELASRASVSGPSVVRFVQAVGFDGFPALQAELRAEITRRMSGPLTRMDSASEATTRAGSASQSELLVQRASEASESAIASLGAIPRGDLEAAIDLLGDTSRSIYLAGGRFTRLAAEYLSLHLEQVRPRVRYLPDPLGVDLGLLVDIGRRSVVVLIDVARYQRSMVELAGRARRRGATVVLITDEQLSPAAAYAQVVLPIAVASPSPFYSALSAFLLAEMIVLPVLKRLGEPAQSRIAMWDDVRASELVGP